jgi:hypothetical protein
MYSIMFDFYHVAVFVLGYEVALRVQFQVDMDTDASATWLSGDPGRTMKSSSHSNSVRFENTVSLQSGTRFATLDIYAMVSPRFAHNAMLRHTRIIQSCVCT